MPPPEKIGIQILPDSQGKPDDIVAGEVDRFRAEKMDEYPDGSESWWMKVYRTDGTSLVIHFTAKTTPLFEKD